MFEETLIRQIIDAWHADQSHPNRGREQKPLPDFGDVRVLIETAFLASIRKEEERPITFSITLLQKDNMKQKLTPGRSQIIMSFNENVPFSPDSVTKLASAFDPMTTSLTVSSKDNSKTVYEIWGVMFYSPPEKLFHTNSCVIGDLNMTVPDIMIVTAVAPGALMIYRGDTVIGRLLSGRFERAIPTPFVSNAMGQYIYNLIKNHEGFSKFQNPYWHVYIKSLIYLLSEASLRSHGGTIVLVPDDKIREYKKYIHPRYVFCEEFLLEGLPERILKEEGENVLESHCMMALRYEYSKRIDFLAQLSCTDGALIISNKLHLLLFASTLNAPKWNGIARIGPDGFGGGGEIYYFSKLGTKHNSAINFVGACSDSIAFVISQDGPVKGFIRKDEKTVLCWPDCLVSMFSSP